MNKNKFRNLKRVLRFITLNLLVCFSLPAYEGANPPGHFAGGGGTGSVPGEKGYVIGPTNLIFIKVLGEDGLQTTYRVDEAGYITHPLIGRLKLAGQTVVQAEATLRKSLQGDYILDPNVTIFILEHSRFSVLGEVRKPGNYEILGQLSLVEGISMAGGFTPVGNQKKVKILRRDESGEKTILVNVKDIIDGRKASMDIQPGDVIEVQTSFF